MIIDNKQTQEIIKNNSKKKNKLNHLLKSFIIGGSFGIAGQALYEFYFSLIKLNKDISTLLASLTLVLFGIMCTAFCIFDDLATHGGAGSFIPIVGFANAMSSAALEGKSEGPIFGVGSKIFSLVGSVFAYGIFTTCICGIIYYIWRLI